MRGLQHGEIAKLKWCEKENKIETVNSKCFLKTVNYGVPVCRALHCNSCLH